jgi:hypothetical protein
VAVILTFENFVTKKKKVDESESAALTAIYNAFGNAKALDGREHIL